MLKTGGKWKTVPIEELRRLFHFDPLTGVIVTATKRKKGHPAGVRVDGNLSSRGRRRVKIHNVCYEAHRVAWALHYGWWPQTFLDHANGDPTDNRITNLREATPSQNVANSRRASWNTSGYKGVVWNKKSRRWQGQIRINGKLKYLGLFPTAEGAHAAYTDAAVKFFGEFARMS